MTAPIRGRGRIADWIETALLVRGERPLGLDALHEYLSSTVGLEPQQSNAGVAEMVRRSERLGEAYPFAVHGDVAVRAVCDAARSHYSALLLLAPGTPVREHLGAAPDETMAVVFENLVVAATARLWGTQGRALRFGWPSDIGRPPEFDQAIPWLASKVGVPVGGGYRQPRRKDGGVDVVAWRPFPDGRSGFPLLLVQCTLQENLLVKSMDVDTRLWSSWLQLDTDPVTAIATPAALSSGTTWNELALKHMVLDRVRLAGLGSNTTVDEVEAEWCAETLNGLEKFMGEVSES